MALEIHPRENAIRMLPTMVRKVQPSAEAVANIHMKALPVFCAYAEMNDCGQKMAAVIVNMLENPVFHPFKNLLTRWHTRFSQKSVQTFKMRNVKISKFSSAELDMAKKIGYEDLDFFISICKWLRYHKLHKYIYFFANISYNDFVNLDEQSSYHLDTEIGLVTMTKGGRDTILRKIDELKSRNRILKNYIQKDYFPPNDPKKIETSLTKIKDILHTPIKQTTRNQEDFDRLPGLLEETITKVSKIALENDTTAELLQRVLKASWSCHFFTNIQKAKFNQLRITTEKWFNRLKHEQTEHTDILKAHSSLTLLYDEKTEESDEDTRKLIENMAAMMEYLERLMMDN